MQICEDIPQVLDSDVPGLAERPINVFLPRLFRVNIIILLSFQFFEFVFLYMFLEPVVNFQPIKFSLQNSFNLF